jgi:hypothetical protein
MPALHSYIRPIPKPAMRTTIIRIKPKTHVLRPCARSRSTRKLSRNCRRDGEDIVTVYAGLDTTAELSANETYRLILRVVIADGVSEDDADAKESRKNKFTVVA